MRNRIILFAVMLSACISLSADLTDSLEFYEDSTQLRIDSTIIADYDMPAVLMPFVNSPDFTKQYIARRIFLKYDNKEKLAEGLIEGNTDKAFIYSVIDDYDVRQELQSESRKDTLYYIDYIARIRQGFDELRQFMNSTDNEIRERALKGMYQYCSNFSNRVDSDSIWALRKMKNPYTDFQISRLLSLFPEFIDSILETDLTRHEAVMIVNAGFMSGDVKIIKMTEMKGLSLCNDIVIMNIEKMKRENPELYKQVNETNGDKDD